MTEMPDADNEDVVHIDAVGWRYNSWCNHDAVGQPYDADDYDGVELGRLLDITFDDQRWMTHYDKPGIDCRADLDDNSGLGDTIFSLVETGDATGIFVGTFPIPAEFCRDWDRAHRNQSQVLTSRSTMLTLEMHQVKPPR